MENKQTEYYCKLCKDNHIPCGSMRAPSPDKVSVYMHQNGGWSDYYNPFTLCEKCNEITWQKDNECKED